MGRCVYENLSLGGRRDSSQGRVIFVGRETNFRGAAKLFSGVEKIFRGGETFVGVEKLT